jgi:hypothetical protein
MAARQHAHAAGTKVAGTKVAGTKVAGTKASGVGASEPAAQLCSEFDGIVEQLAPAAGAVAHFDDPAVGVLTDEAATHGHSRQDLEHAVCDATKGSHGLLRLINTLELTEDRGSGSLL